MPTAEPAALCVTVALVVMVLLDGAVVAKLA